MAEREDEPPKPDLDSIHTLAPERSDLGMSTRAFTEHSALVTPSVVGKTMGEFKGSLKEEMTRDLGATLREAPGELN